MIVLINFNDYLGGGETLMVRFSKYLQKNSLDFIAVCQDDSYINRDLQKKEINKASIRTISSSPNFFYLNYEERLEFIDDLLGKIGNKENVRLVTFCMRDLYTAVALSSKLETSSITHLILHTQDDLYLGQTLLDKVIYKIFHRRRFSGINNISFNRRLLSIINMGNGLISMADIISKAWKNNFSIEIPDSHVVPLPSFTSFKEKSNHNFNTKKIIWIGRIVDFKIPSVIAMIDFINTHKEYSLTIVGDGKTSKLHKYIDKFSIDKNRIKFIGEVAYEDLGSIIKMHSIGYAMGTSLIELAKYQIPVIIALASYDHKFFDRQICGGLFYNKAKGCDGSDLVLTSQENIKSTIGDVIDEIDSDYDRIAKACYTFAENGYSETLNFAKYVDIINKTDLLSGKERKIDIAYSSPFRKYLLTQIKNG